MKKIVLFLLVTTSFGLSDAQTLTPPDDYILDQMRVRKLPGVAVTTIKDGKVALTRGYGLANIDKDIPYTPNTIQGVQSISKVVTATAIMKLWEENEFELDDPINNYLPFPVTNPFYPNVAITFRMLLTHTSSVNTGTDVSIESPQHSPRFPPGTAPALGSYLQSYFVPGGSLYIDSVSFFRVEPGTQFIYGNYAYALLGYLTEQISGMPFHQFCNQKIFDPLCMNNTAWYYSELDPNLIATPYDEITSYNHATPHDLYEWANYPGMGLKSTTADISRFMQMHLNHGQLEGVRIIEPETEEMMRTVHLLALDNANFKIQFCLGLFKVTEYNNNNTVLFGHDGTGPGVVTHSYFTPATNTAITVFSNCYNPLINETTIRDIHIKIHTEISPTIPTADKPVLNCSYQLNPCQQNESYWKTHQPEWPINSVPMKIGTKHYYSKNQILELLNSNANGDASITLGKALAVAKFNLGQGSEMSQIISTVTEAMNMIGDKRLPYNVPVPVSSPIGIQMLALAATLNSYNTGNMNVTSCSGTSSITFNNVMVEMENEGKAYSMSVFPNPSFSNTTVSFNVAMPGKVSLAVYDITGKLIKTIAHKEFGEGIHQVRIDTDRMSTGVYIIKLQSNEILLTKKFVVQH